MRTSSLVFASLVLAVAVPSIAKDTKDTKKAPSVHVDKKSLATCTTFDQLDKDEDTVLMSIASSCEIPIDCSITWKLVCAPSSKTRRVEHAKSAAFKAMTAASSQSTEASASACGADSWSIEQVVWACTPNKD